jgi:hypothetical protein
MRRVADWSLLGMTAAAIADAFLEAVPDVVWNEDRLEALRGMLGAELKRVALLGSGERPGGRTTDRCRRTGGFIEGFGTFRRRTQS